MKDFSFFILHRLTHHDPVISYPAHLQTLEKRAQAAIAKMDAKSGAAYKQLCVRKLRHIHLARERLQAEEIKDEAKEAHDAKFARGLVTRMLSGSVACAPHDFNAGAIKPSDLDVICTFPHESTSSPSGQNRSRRSRSGRPRSGDANAPSVPEK
eukprot:GHVT01082839.1.p1 GENE.GHVT01082839.1~~GHVT01082839.1.p1  ORF type:complete len:154 (+),score=12.68 GHVT01082839.1:165-626(+)